MKPPRRSRTLTGEEARLWGEIARLITPLRGRVEPKRGPDAGAPKGPVPVEARRPSPAAPPKPAERPRAVLPVSAKVAGRPLKLSDLAPAAASQPSPPPVAAPVARVPAGLGLERRDRIGLRRGTLAIEARIDLHGLYQADAHAALIGFLRRARAEGHARVLVVTGKGGMGSGGMGRGGDTVADPGFSERGVLRRSVPHWLRGPDLRSLVLGFEEAGRQHGGAGALYVRLRRR